MPKMDLWRPAGQMQDDVCCFYSLCVFASQLVKEAFAATSGEPVAALVEVESFMTGISQPVGTFSVGRLDHASTRFACILMT